MYSSLLTVPLHPLQLLVHSDLHCFFIHVMVSLQAAFQMTKRENLVVVVGAAVLSTQML
jgi:hypothetical protein